MREVLYNRSSETAQQNEDASSVLSSAGALGRAPFSEKEIAILERETRALILKGMFVTSSLALDVMSRNGPHFDHRSPKCVENKLRSLVIRARVTDSLDGDTDASGKSKRARRRVLYIVEATVKSTLARLSEGVAVTL